MTPFWLLLGCSACSACFEPNLDDVTPEDSHEDQDSPEDSPEDSPVDTTPPPPCAQPEVEPNNNSSTAFPIQMESWACGDFGTALDFDVYTFDMAEEGWLEVVIEAAERGSPAHVLLTMNNEQGQDVGVGRGDTSTDVRVVVPVMAGNWVVWLNELNQDYGEDVDYHLMATATKRPVSWNVDSEALEVPNNSVEAALQVHDGDAIWGVIDSSTNFDWYVWESPKDTQKRTLRLTVTAMSEGSPLNPRLQRWDLNTAGELSTTPTSTWDSSETSASQDPQVEISVADKDVYLKVRNTPGYQTGELYWYVLAVEVD